MIRRTLLLLNLLAAGVCAAQAPATIVLNEKEYFSAPGFSFLMFHNNYQVGHQGGLQMIQNGERLLDSGDLLLMRKDGEQAETQVLRREVDRERATATVIGEIAGGSGYRLVCRTDGGKIVVTLQLERPVDWSRYAAAGFRIALYPGAYFGKSFRSESGHGVFPRQYTGKRELLGGVRTLRVAEEDAARAFTIARTDGGTLTVIDPREDGPQDWFLVVAPIEAGSRETEITVAITPSIQPGWKKSPVIGVSQVGYLPAQAKRAVIELGADDAGAEPATLWRLGLSGRTKVKSEPPKPWGRFLRYGYAIFDFSEVREPGVYVLEFRGATAGPFRIAADVYELAWRPTLQYFLPVQMCHVAIREGSRTWHGACHLDDARQAPANKRYIDGYVQGERETRFADDEFVPGLDWGGWHDAGDHDVPAGSIAMTVLPLVLAQEEFHPAMDETTVRRADREVLLHVADGRQDLLQQIEYGVEGLLASFRTGGTIYPGIIERTGRAYTHVGDPANITDNVVWDAKRMPAARLDDRWVFTNRNTGLQYMAAQALAAASRVLRSHDARLAEECLAAAVKLWEDEQARPPVYTPNSYAPRDSGYRSEEMDATGELLLTTGEERYRRRLKELMPQIRSMTAEQFGDGPGWTLARVMPRIEDGEFRKAVAALGGKWNETVRRRAATNPFGVPYPPQVSSPEWRLETRTGIHSGFVWGHGWDLQSEAMRQYFYRKHLPEVFDSAVLRTVVDFVHGCHPANNESFVSGVGAVSPIIAYGYSRADWSHIPGGVISGVSLVKPDFMELKEFPFLWYQTEYVISGAATYIFDLLAAQAMMRQ